MFSIDFSNLNFGKIFRESTLVNIAHPKDCFIMVKISFIKFTEVYSIYQRGYLERSLDHQNYHLKSSKFRFLLLLTLKLLSISFCPNSLSHKLILSNQATLPYPVLKVGNFHQIQNFCFTLH